MTATLAPCHMLRSALLARAEVARAQPRVAVLWRWLAHFNCDAAVYPTGQAPAKIIPRALEAMTELRQPNEAESAQLLERSTRATTGATTHDQRVRGSESGTHHSRELGVLNQAVTQGPLPRDVARSRRASQCKF